MKSVCIYGANGLTAAKGVHQARLVLAHGNYTFVLSSEYCFLLFLRVKKGFSQVIPNEFNEDRAAAGPG